MSRAFGPFGTFSPKTTSRLLLLLLLILVSYVNANNTNNKRLSKEEFSHRRIQSGPPHPKFPHRRPPPGYFNSNNGRRPRPPGPPPFNRPPPHHGHSGGGGGKNRQPHPPGSSAHPPVQDRERDRPSSSPPRGPPPGPPPPGPPPPGPPPPSQQSTKSQQQNYFHSQQSSVGNTPNNFGKEQPTINQYAPPVHNFVHNNNNQQVVKNFNQGQHNQNQNFNRQNNGQNFNGQSNGQNFSNQNFGQNFNQNFNGQNGQNFNGQNNGPGFGSPNGQNFNPQGGQNGQNVNGKNGQNNGPNFNNQNFNNQNFNNQNFNNQNFNNQNFNNQNFNSQNNQNNGQNFNQYDGQNAGKNFSNQNHEQNFNSQNHGQNVNGQQNFNNNGPQNYRNDNNRNNNPNINGPSNNPNFNPQNSQNFNSQPPQNFNSNPQPSQNKNFIQNPQQPFPSSSNQINQINEPEKNVTKQTITFTVHPKPSGTSINFQISTPKPFRGTIKPILNPSTYRPGSPPPPTNPGYPNAAYSMEKLDNEAEGSINHPQQSQNILLPPPVNYDPNVHLEMNKMHSLNHEFDSPKSDPIKEDALKYSQPDPLYHPEEEETNNSTEIQVPKFEPPTTEKVKEKEKNQAAEQLLAALGLSKNPLVNMNQEEEGPSPHEPLGLMDYLKNKEPLFAEPDRKVQQAPLLPPQHQDFIVSSSIQADNIDDRHRAGQVINDDISIETYSHTNLRPPLAEEKPIYHKSYLEEIEKQQEDQKVAGSKAEYQNSGELIKLHQHKSYLEEKLRQSYLQDKTHERIPQPIPGIPERILPQSSSPDRLLLHPGDRIPEEKPPTSYLEDMLRKNPVSLPPVLPDRHHSYIEERLKSPVTIPQHVEDKLRLPSIPSHSYLEEKFNHRPSLIDKLRHDEKIRQSINEEKIRQLNEEKLRQSLHEEKIRQSINEEKIRQLNEEKFRHSLNEEKRRHQALNEQRLLERLPSSHERPQSYVEEKLRKPYPSLEKKVPLISSGERIRHPYIEEKVHPEYLDDRFQQGGSYVEDKLRNPYFSSSERVTDSIKLNSKFGPSTTQSSTSIEDHERYYDKVEYPQQVQQQQYHQDKYSHQALYASSSENKQNSELLQNYGLNRQGGQIQQQQQQSQQQQQNLQQNQQQQNQQQNQQQQQQQHQQPQVLLPFGYQQNYGNYPPPAGYPPQQYQQQPPAIYPQQNQNPQYQQQYQQTYEYNQENTIPQYSFQNNSNTLLQQGSINHQSIINPNSFNPHGLHPHHDFHPTQSPHINPIYIVTEPEPIIEIIVQDSNVTLPPYPTLPPYVPPPPTPEPVHVFYVKYSQKNKTVFYDDPYNSYSEPEINLENPIASVSVRGPDRDLQIDNVHAEASEQHPVVPTTTTTEKSSEEGSSTTLRTLIVPGKNEYSPSKLAIHFDEPPKDYPFDMSKYLLNQPQQQDNYEEHQQPEEQQQEQQQQQQQQNTNYLSRRIGLEDLESLLGNQQQGQQKGSSESEDKAHMLPSDVPTDLKEQLISSGILNNADVQVLNFDENLFKELSKSIPQDQQNFNDEEVPLSEAHEIKKRSIDKIFLKDDSLILLSKDHNKLFKLNPKTGLVKRIRAI